MMKTIAIIGAMPQELEFLRTNLSNLETITSFGKIFYTGYYQNNRLVLSLSGIGKVNAATATTLAITNFSPDAVINTGSAGGLGHNIHIGDVVIADSVAHHDVDVCAFGYTMGQIPQLPVHFSCDTHLSHLATQAASTFEEAVIHCGLIISGDQFIDNIDKISNIRCHFPEALACEMEAAAIAQVCYQLKVPFVVVRAISDHADEKANITFDQFIEKASRKSADMVLAIMRKL